MKVLEGLFTAVIVVGFIFWIYARAIAKKPALELYEDIMDSIFHTEDYGDISQMSSGKFKNPFKKFKDLGVSRVNMHTPRESKSKPQWK